MSGMELEKVIIEDPENAEATWTKELMKGLHEMQQSTILCDVVINTNDNKYYSVHSSVLAASSAFFCEILNQSKQSGAGIVIKLEKSSSVVEALINFLYTGQASIEYDELDSFRHMTEGYAMTHLTKLIAEKQYQMTLGNLVKVTEDVEAQEDAQEVSEMDDQMICETETQVACELDSELEVQVDNIAKAHLAITHAAVPDLKMKPKRFYNTGGPKKTWRDYKYTCPYCGKVFTSLSRMQGHQALHTGEKKHECNICGQKFIQIEYLREHVTIHSTNKPFECLVCGVKFRLQRHLKKHQQSHNSDKAFECELCHKMFKRKLGLLQHMRIHNDEKPFQCPVCERRFRHKEALFRHKTAVHAEQCPFQCGFCNVGFTQLSGLKAHQNHCSVALKKRPLTCMQCNRTFQTTHTLNKHIHMKHPGMPSNYKKVAEEEVEKAALRSKGNASDDQEFETNSHIMQASTVEELLGQELVVDPNASEIILQGLENGIVLQDGSGLEIQTDEDGKMVYQVLTLQMGDDEGTTVLTTAPIMESDEVTDLTSEES